MLLAFRRWLFITYLSL